MSYKCYKSQAMINLLSNRLNLKDANLTQLL